MSNPGTLETRVAVVGAGPAGATAARELALLGIDTVIVEREELPRYKTCGGGLVGRAFNQVAAVPGVMECVERSCCRAELGFGPHARRYTVEREQPIVQMTMRDRFDWALVRAAVDAGARIRDGSRVTGLSARPPGIVLETTRGPIAASLAIAADGAVGTLTRLVGWHEPRRLAPALEMEIRCTHRTLEQFADRASFDFGFTRYGYAWVFPKREHVSVGILSTRHGARGLRRELDGYLAAQRIDSGGDVERHGALIPLTARRAPWLRMRVLPVGDAAGLVDPITCEGISFAIRSGRIAGRAIADAGPDLDPVRVERAYARRLGRDVLPELRAARLFATLLYDRPRLRSHLLHRLGQSLCEAMTDIMAGTRTYREILRNPSTYWKLLRRGLLGKEPACGSR